MVKIDEYIGFCDPRRSYLLGSPVIVRATNSGPPVNKYSSPKNPDVERKKKTEPQTRWTKPMSSTCGCVKKIVFLVTQAID